MLQLFYDLADVNLSQAKLARLIEVSASTVNVAIKNNVWPHSDKPRAPHMCEAVLKERIRAVLIKRGLPNERLEKSFNEVPASPSGNSDPQALASGPHLSPEEDIFMLLRHHSLSSAARQHFKVPRDPFVNELNQDADVFVTDDIRYVRAALRQTAKHGGMLAVSAESGSGKSTLRKDLIDWINQNNEPITVIEPYVLGMEDTEQRGKALKAGDLTGAVIRRLAPGQRLRASAQDRAAQMHGVLKSSAQIGRKHVLVIEEAHALAIPTLKHLKRFYELEDGFKKLLAIILIGQNELELKLSEHNPEVREVVQRCELVRLPPIDNHVGEYLAHKFRRVEMDVDAVLTPDGIEAVRSTLRQTVSETSRGQRMAREMSLCYPLAINNLVTRAMNEAVKIGAPKVNAALIAAAFKGA